MHRKKEKKKSILFSVFELFADIPVSFDLLTGMSYCRCAVAVNMAWDEKEGCLHGHEAKGKVNKSIVSSSSEIIHDITDSIGYDSYVIIPVTALEILLFLSCIIIFYS